MVVCMLFVAGWAILLNAEPFAWIDWHDWQRLAQILLSMMAVLAVVRKKIPLPFGGPVSFCLGAILLGGVASSLLAHQPIWAFAELALMLGCLAIFWAVAGLRRVGGADLDFPFVGAVVIICGLKAAGFLVGYLAAIFSGVEVLSVSALFDGFSWIRFYGQFQSLTLPVLVAPLMMGGRWRRYSVLIFIILVCWWVIAIAGATRGTWLGMAVALLVIMLCGPAGRLWAGWQAAAIMLGGCVFYILFKAVPYWFGLEIGGHGVERITASLSGRDILWKQAWEMIVGRPWLGFGPMHFADFANPLGAHPHQFILQWACEWGVPSVLLFFGIIARGVFGVFRSIRDRIGIESSVDFLRVCLAGSLIASLSQAMVDGVFVMPNTQVWLAIVAGWLIAIHPASVPLGNKFQVGSVVFVSSCIVGVGVLLVVAVRDVPRLVYLQDSYQEEFGWTLKPRFWLQGTIALPAK